MSNSNNNTPARKIQRYEMPINGFYSWSKDADTWINRYFHSKEFSCQCEYDTCKTQRIAADLINRLTKLRERKNTPMRITSAYRCQRHQNDLRRSHANTIVAKVSRHSLGTAVDVAFPSLRIEEWLDDALEAFEGVGIATNFIHLDIRDDKKKSRWNY